MDGVSLSFSWQPPAGDGLILSYTLICSVNGLTAVNATLNPILEVMLDELKPATSYLCSIYASTSGGAGPSTDAVTITTESESAK